jgi:hypothetical protein
MRQVRHRYAQFGDILGRAGARSVAERARYSLSLPPKLVTFSVSGPIRFVRLVPFEHIWIVCFGELVLNRDIKPVVYPRRGWLRYCRWC